MEEWHYQPAEDLDQTLAQRLRRFPREPDMLVYGARLTGALAIRLLLKIWHRFTIRGQEHLPTQGSFIMVANHASHLDALCLLSALPMSKLHRAFPAAAADYFFVSLPRLALASIIVNALPFHRQTHIRQSVSLCQNLLANDSPGNILILFPEGTRSPDGRMQDFKPGIGRLVAGTTLPVLPCFLEGTGTAWPKGAWCPGPRKVSLTIGPPLRFENFGQSREDHDAIAAALHQAVLALNSNP
jgi:1-acyl-sn-glycerol-3-phosphate acyltransferase